MTPSEFLGILPEIICAVGGILLLLLPRIQSALLLGFVTLNLLAAALNLKLLNFFQIPLPQEHFYGMVLQDRFGAFFQILILMAMGLVVVHVLSYSKEQFRTRRELYALLLLVTVGLLIVVEAQHLALIYIGLELVSIFSYILTGFLKKDSLAVEGALKYFLFGSLATGVMLYGISLLYGLTGTLDLPFCGAACASAMKQAPILGLMSLLFILIGLGFKVALVPFHMWAPDAYEGAATPVTAFLSVAPKLAGFAVVGRLLCAGFSPDPTLRVFLFGGLALLTMTVGNVVAVVQTNVKRLLAYSSIAQAGTMLVGLAAANPMGLTATLYYLIAYLFMNMAAFAGVIAVENASGREDISAFTGLSRRQPFLAAMVTMAFLSLAGIPPTAGFFAKMWIFGAALKAHLTWLAVGAALNSVVSLFYYMKVVKTMYLDPSPVPETAFLRLPLLRVSLVLCTCVILVIGLLPGHWLTLVSAALPLPSSLGTFSWM